MPFAITMPKLSPTMEEGTIAKWHVLEGDLVKSGQVLIEVATDKANLEYQALDGGYIRKILVEENQSAKVNDPIAIIAETLDESIENILLDQKVSYPAPQFTPEPPLQRYQFPTWKEETSYVKASPLAKKMAQEEGLDLYSVQGTGPGGTVVAKDLSFAQKNALHSFAKKAAPTTTPGSYKEVAPTSMRKVIGKRLQESKSFIPHFYIHQDVNVSSLVAIRKELKDMDVKLTVNDFVVRAAALSLKQHPVVNSGYNSVEQKIIYFQTVDISVAVTLPEGLITPIIRHADYKTIGQLSLEMKQLAQKAKQGKLQPEEYQGGSFTISNLGMFGVSDFVAVINPPQSAILAVSGIEERPVVKNGKIWPAHMMRLSLSADHRVVDGMDGAKFIKTVQKFLENPSVLLL